MGYRHSNEVRITRLDTTVLGGAADETRRRGRRQLEIIDNIKRFGFHKSFIKEAKSWRATVSGIKFQPIGTIPCGDDLTPHCCFQLHNKPQKDNKFILSPFALIYV